MTPEHIEVEEEAPIVYHEHEVLIGQMPYQPVNSNARQKSYPDGSFVMELWRQSVEEPDPYIKVALSGPGKRIVMLEEQEQHIFQTVENDDEEIYSLVISGPKDLLAVGNYEVEALINGTEQVKKYVSIIDSPFATGANSKYLSSLSDSDGGWVLKGEYPINGGETGVEVRYYRPFLRTPNWVSAALYDENDNPLDAYTVSISDITSERFQVNFNPTIPDDVDYTLVWAAWV